MATKLRILCLHGWQQSAVVFQRQCAELERALSSMAEFVYVDATIGIPREGAPHEEPRKFSWWDASTSVLPDGSKEHVYGGWREAVERVKAHVAKERIDGVLGFSQGAAVSAVALALAQGPSHRDALPEAAALAAGLERLRFGILVGGFTPRDIEIRPLIEGRSPVEIPTLHVIGSGDTLVVPAASRNLASHFGRKRVLEHGGGHEVPFPTAEVTAAFADFLEPLRPKAPPRL